MAESPFASLRRAALDALAVIAPTTCSGCGAVDRAVCAACRARLRPVPRRIALGGEAGIPVWSSTEYAGVVRRLIVAFKDTQRTDCGRELARLLRPAVARACGAAAGPAELTVVPSSREAWRSRGYHPVRTLARRAGLPVSAVLRQRRASADQAGLSALQRRQNRRQSMAAVPTAAGRSFVIVDDVVTTGSTLIEAARALREAGATVVGCAVVAHTPKRAATRSPGHSTASILHEKTLGRGS